MVDCQIYGLKAGGHHVTNLLLHLINTLLVFVVFRRLTGAAWRSGLIAGVFGLHPLHVETVAWVADRKDVLSTVFWLLTLWAYARYSQTLGAKLEVRAVTASNATSRRQPSSSVSFCPPPTRSRPRGALD